MRRRKGERPKPKGQTIKLGSGVEIPNPFAPFLHLHEEAARESALISEEEAARYWRENLRQSSPQILAPLVWTNAKGKTITIP